MTAPDSAAISAQRRLVVANPRDVIALHNLGVELRRADRLEEALATMERALALGAVAPETATVHAHLLADFGRFDEAVAAYRRVLDTHPGHIDAHETLARLLPQIGQRAAAFDAYADALARAPHMGALWMSALAAAKDLRDGDRLLDWVAAAEARFGSEPFLGLLAAQAHSWRGEDGAALARLLPVIAADPDNAGAQATLAQLAIRTGDLATAEAAALAATRIAPDEQTGWSLLTVIWRLTGDAREAWLADYDRLVMEIDLDGIDLAATAAVLGGLHRTAEHPAEQSLRGGTQTRGILFDKADPAIRALRDSISRGIGGALAGLSDDAAHPFLRRKRPHFAFAGSWSVRLRSEGHHIGHIHPAGWLSSAAYIDLPSEVVASEQEGALAFGVPETLLGLDLAQRRIIAPRPGKLVLFPSYFWHGTLPFTSTAPRLTVAFDALPVDKSSAQQ
ncbi:putative 2OG-Fe(II) oxygenase [Sphingomonas sp. SUN039]|uniref:putative 2OG-Fe(II) oxygenase n=1 Tax=Sphingomonas sp. SUN039 TaxID=2937787 RepID=UPI002164687D|nr:putative 2OG-Fe(II) oxygenase [Sphingomonas sp. SUN039]UVO53813.1 putative 2OG-Fe(II) oxygenase [Sphingomonas sp. SUN039]